MLDEGVNHLRPTPYSLMKYLGHLHRLLPSPASVVNAYWGARTWVRESGHGSMGGPHLGFL